MTQRPTKPILLAQVVGQPNGQLQVNLMPGLEADEQVAMLNQCIQAMAARQMQLLNATHASKPKILVPEVGFRL
jgi:hypothetical protein